MLRKTRMAETYASQFVKPDENDKKHTFWVSMKDINTIHDSYEKIAQEINDLDNVSPRRPAEIVKHIEEWLQDSEKGHWILVLDGLNDDSLTSQNPENVSNLLDLRKIQHHGQILITTRREDISDKLFDQREHEKLQLTPPNLDDRLRMYHYFVKDSSFPLVDKNTRDLLEYLVLPTLIEEAVKYMKEMKITPQALLQRIREGDQKVEGFSKDILGFLLNHILTDELGSELESVWPYEIQILFMLAMFGQEGAKLKLLDIEMNEQNDGSLDQALATLRKSFLVHRSNVQSDYALKSDGPQEVLRIDKIVQVAVWARIEREERRIVLGRFNKMLSMIYNHYDDKVHEDKLIRFELRKELLTHFERFLKIVEAEERTGNFEDSFNFAQQAIRGIIEFSRALSDKDRYKEAIRVLNFAEQYCTAIEVWSHSRIDDEVMFKLEI